MQGTPIPEVSAMLGHANVNITLAVYAHFIPKMRTDSSARLAAAIFGTKPSADGVGHFGRKNGQRVIKWRAVLAL